MGSWSSLPLLPPRLQPEPGAAGLPCPTAAGGSPAPPLWGTDGSKPLGFLWKSSPPSSDPQQALPVTPSYLCRALNHGTERISLAAARPWSSGAGSSCPADRSGADCDLLNPQLQVRPKELPKFNTDNRSRAGSAWLRLPVRPQGALCTAARPPVRAMLNAVRARRGRGRARMGICLSKSTCGSCCAASGKAASAKHLAVG